MKELTPYSDEIASILSKYKDRRIIFCNSRFKKKVLWDGGVSKNKKRIRYRGGVWQYICLEEK